MRIQNSPPPQLPRNASKLAPKPGGPQQPQRPLTRGDKHVIEWAETNSTNLSQGQKMVIDLGDGHRYVVEGTGITPAQRGFSAIQQFLTAGVQEVQAAIQAGPSLALTGAAEVVKPMVLNNAPYEVVANIDQWYQPGLMGASVGLALVKFISTYNAHKARKAKGQKDTFIQSAGMVTNFVHMAACTAGLGAAITGALVPSLRGATNVVQGVALGTNVVAFGFNWLEYFNNRKQTLNPLGDIKKQQ